MTTTERPPLGIIRVRVTTTYEVDADAWATEWGVEHNAKAVRDDVKSYFGNNVPGHLDHIVQVEWS